MKFHPAITQPGCLRKWISLASLIERTRERTKPVLEQISSIWLVEEQICFFSLAFPTSRNHFPLKSRRFAKQILGDRAMQAGEAYSNIVMFEWDAEGGFAPSRGPVLAGDPETIVHMVSRPTGLMPAPRRRSRHVRTDKALPFQYRTASSKLQRLRKVG